MNDEVRLKLMVSMREGGHSERFMLIMKCFCGVTNRLCYNEFSIYMRLCAYNIDLNNSRKKKICDDGARQAKSFIVNGMEQVVTTGLLEINYNKKK